LEKWLSPITLKLIVQVLHKPLQKPILLAEPLQLLFRASQTLNKLSTAEIALLALLTPNRILNPFNHKLRN